MGCILVVSSPWLSRFRWLTNVSPIASHHCNQCFNQPRSKCSKCSRLAWGHKRRRLSKPSTGFSKSSSQWRALRTVTPWLIVTLVAMVGGKGTHVGQPPETWEPRGTHDKKAPLRKQNLLRPRRCFWVT